MRKYLTRRNVIIAIVVVFILGWWWNGRRAADKKNGSVKTTEVTRGKVVSYLSVSGQVKADQQAVLNFPAPGKLSYIGVKEGDLVKSGKLLASLDLGDLQTAWNRAYYQYLAADANAKLVEDQVKDHDKDESFVQKNTRVAAQTARDMAYDTMLAAERAINNAKLTAPFEGIVTTVTATAVGDTVSVTDGVTVVNPKSLYFSAEVDESDVGKVSQIQKVEVNLDAYPGEKFSASIGEIGFVSQLSSTGATVYPVKLRFPPEVLSKLRIGMNGDAKIILAVKENVLKLPVEAIVDGEVILDGQEKKKIKVVTGLEGDMDTEIVSGINEGIKVVIQ